MLRQIDKQLFGQFPRRFIFVGDIGTDELIGNPYSTPDAVAIWTSSSSAGC